MSQTLSLLRGQRTKLSDPGLSQGAFTLELALAPASVTVDSACFGLDSHRRLADERYMTFFNQPQSPCGGVRQRGTHTFDIDLARLPDSIDALVVTLATESAEGLHALLIRHDLFMKRRKPLSDRQSTFSPAPGFSPASSCAQSLQP